MSNETPENGTTEHLFSFAKNEAEEIHLALRKYKGRYYVDLRLWFQENENDPFKPTKKGFSISADHLPQLKEGIHQLGQAYFSVKPGVSARVSPEAAKPQAQAPRTDGGTRTWNRPFKKASQGA